MGYDRGDSFPFDFEPNGSPFGSKSKGKLSPRSYPIHCQRKRKYSFLSVLSLHDLSIMSSRPVKWLEPLSILDGYNYAPLKATSVQLY